MRMLWFGQGSFSNTNEAVLSGLRKELGAAEIRSCDITSFLKSHPLRIATGAAAALSSYGWDLARGARSLDDAFWGTPYMFRKIRELSLSIHRNFASDCSFQTQSMFDCSCPGVPHFVYTDHTYESCREYPDYGRVLWAPRRPAWLVHMERQVYANAHRVFTMSGNVSRTLMERYGLPEEKVICVGAGCNAGGSLSGIPTGLARYCGKRILFAGRLWRLKGGPQLLAAFEKVRQKHPDAKLTIAGCDPKAYGPGVEVIGFVNLKRMAEQYAGASVFCMPSRIEAFGIVFIEAMLSGLPVVALRLGAAPDFIMPGKTGFLVEPDDIDGLAGALSGLLDDPVKSQVMGAEARALAMRTYTWDTVCRNMAQCIVGQCTRH